MLPLALGGFYVADYLSRQALRTDLQERHLQAASSIVSDRDCWNENGSAAGDLVWRQACDLNVTYVLGAEHGGGVRQRRVRWSGRPPANPPPIVYDPADPDRAMFSSELDRPIDRAGLNRAYLLGALALLVLLLLGPKWVWDLMQRFRPPNILFVEITNLRRSVSSRYKFAFYSARVTTPDGEVRQISLRRPPFVLKSRGSPARALALEDHRGRISLIDHNLRPLLLTDEQRQHINEAAGAERLRIPETPEDAVIIRG